jgi:hypothetical protein
MGHSMGGFLLFTLDLLDIMRNGGNVLVNGMMVVSMGGTGVQFLQNSGFTSLLMGITLRRHVL